MIYFIEKSFYSYTIFMNTCYLQINDIFNLNSIVRIVSLFIKFWVYIYEIYFIMIILFSYFLQML